MREFKEDEELFPVFALLILVILHTNTRLFPFINTSRKLEGRKK
jgi:hypothetical protein